MAVGNFIKRHQQLVVVASLSLGVLLASTDVSSASKKQSKQHQQQRRLKVNPVTEAEDAWTASTETDVYQAGTYENLSLGYSDSHGWDLSLSLINAQILGRNNQFIGDTFVNVAKTFEMTDTFSIVLGTHNGVALVNLHPQRWYNYSYLDNRFDATTWLTLHGGPYLANAAITGTVRQVGVMAGVDITLVPRFLSLEMDYISGHQALSGGTANLLINLTARCQMYLGMTVPETHSGNEYSGIIGFILSTKDL